MDEKEGTDTGKSDPEQDIKEKKPDSEDEEEDDLLSQLMEKVQNAGALGNEVDSDLFEFTERVGGVIDSLDRIENIEKRNLEDRFLFKEETDDFQVGNEAEITPDNEQKMEIDDHSQNTEHQGSPNTSVLRDIIGQIHVGTDSPYKEVSEGGIHPDEAGNLVTHYKGDIARIMENLKRLIVIKLEKSREDEAQKLMDLAISIGGGAPSFEYMFKDILDRMKIDTDTIVDEYEIEIDDKETNVLDPALADNIGILQKKARSALDRLKSQLEKSDISGEGLSRINEIYIQARQLFNEKRFQKSYKITLEGLDSIKNHTQEYLDNKIQDTLFKAKGMIEEIEKKRKGPSEELIEDLKEKMDKAMKAYLINEYEKANLLAKKVMETLIDLGELDGTPVRERSMNLHERLNIMKGKNIFIDETTEIGAILSTADDLIKRKDGDSARKLLDQSEKRMGDLEGIAETYTRSREMEIRISNRLEMLDDSDHDLTDARRKLDYLKDYITHERFTDALEIGSDLEKELEYIENLGMDRELRSMITELEGLMKYTGEMEDGDRIRERFGVIKSSFEKGDFGGIEQEARSLISDLKNRMKTLGVEKARRIVDTMTDIKVLSMKMRSLNLDQTDVERVTRNIKNMIKEGSWVEGLNKMDELKHDMKGMINEHTERMKALTRIHRDSLEVIMDRHRDKSVIFYIKKRHIPILRKMEEMGRFKSAIDGYERLSGKFSGLKLPEDRKNNIETDLTECKFEIYKRKEEGMDISKPLALYSSAQKKFRAGEPVPAEYLVEISRRYCDHFLPLSA